MKLSEKDFEGILVSLLTERKDLSDCIFTEINHPTFNSIIRATKNGEKSDLVVSGLYNRYKNGDESFQDLVDAAASMFTSSFEKAEAKNCEDNTEGNFEEDSDEMKSLIENISEIFDTKKEKFDLLKEVTGFFVSKKVWDNYQGYASTDILGMTFVYNKGSLENEALISADEISRLGISEEELHDAALNNMVANHTLNFKVVAGGVLVSNDIRKRGAAAFLYPDFLKEISNRLFNDDLFIIPVSEDAVYVVPVECQDETLTKAQLLMKKNTETLLIKNVLYYNRVSDTTRIF